MSMLESYFTKVAEFHRWCFPVCFPERFLYRTTINCYFGTKKGRCKYWSSIVLFQSGITSKKIKVQIFKFLLQVPFRYHFRGVMFEERFYINKNIVIVFVGKERKEFFFENSRAVLSKC